MDTKINNNLSYIALISLFFIGNTVINLPFGENINGSLPGFFIAVLASIPFVLRISKISLSANKSFFGVTVTCLFVMYALFCGIVTLRNYVTFSDKIILPEIGSFFPSLLFLGLLWLICREKGSVLLKLSLISALLVFITVIILFLLSLNNISLKALIPNKSPTLKEIGYQALSYLSMSFIEGVVLIGIIKEKKRKAILGGFLTGAAVLLIVLLQSVSVFGYSLLSNLNYPYASAMSVITFGDKFSRMEGFSYLLYFFCTLIKTAVCIKAAKSALCKFFPKTEKYFMPAVLTVYALLCVFTDFFVNLPFMTVAPFLTIPAVILTILAPKYN